ncbi:MAG TPA: sugar phosphate isomerase/epimerase [Gemmatales bacterium]|nr:sugar phosphate isomerase/epimerase [Gemmatales bacterium]HMP59641.1 sugar phosphate isomerase/epimerase [Gemmatales bacterium]
MKLGYNTNGFAHHRLEDALAILAELGYRSIALTLDWNTVYPGMAGLEQACSQLDRQRRDLGLEFVIETGARFLLDPRRKHQPTLIDPDPQARARRRQFLLGAFDLAVRLEAKVVSLWSGSPVAAESTEQVWDRLVTECRGLCMAAAARGLRLAFEPEPGMWVATMADFARLHAAVADPHLGLTLDAGHLFCQDEGSIPDFIRTWRDWLWNVHLEDMRRGEHEHLPFGSGAMDLPPILAALDEIGYTGGVHVELSRHSHDAVATAQCSRDFLVPLGHWVG